MSEELSFFNQVYEIVKCIPFGRVTSYGAIAKYLGTAKSSRMVGWAMNNSHVALQNIPAHRVVNRIGLLSGKQHFETGDEMKKILEKEGLEIVNDQIQNFSHHFWDPQIELKY